MRFTLYKPRSARVLVIAQNARAKWLVRKRKISRRKISKACISNGIIVELWNRASRSARRLRAVFDVGVDAVLTQLIQDLQNGNVQSAVIWFTGTFLAVIIGISLHEFSHALIAYRLGDMSPVRDGRLTINPMAHFDVLGTIMILFIGFGYGKPVMVNPYAFRIDRRTGMALVAIAGPITNILIALVFGLTVRLLIYMFTETESLALVPVIQIFSIIVLLNVGLALFNMIPFPPLDGSKVLLALLPGEMAYSVEKFYVQTQQFGMIVLMLLIWVGGGFIGSLLSTPQFALFSLFASPQAFLFLQ